MKIRHFNRNETKPHRVDGNMCPICSWKPLAKRRRQQELKDIADELTREGQRIGLEY